MRLLLAALAAFVAVPIGALAGGTPGQEKLSPYLRRVMSGRPGLVGSRGLTAAAPLRVFVKLASGADASLVVEAGGEVLAESGGVLVADLSAAAVARLAADSAVVRMEMEPAACLQLDSVRAYVRADEAQRGASPLGQAFTGKGVVVGIVDSGFDLTHPTYRDSLGRLRVSAFWDMMAAGRSNNPSGGRTYNSLTIGGLAHSRGALYLNHANHVAGIAAGSGAEGKWRGLAPEADIVGVDRYTASVAQWLADSVSQQMKTATSGALAFKYIFDYAQSQGKPCVANLSIGSSPTFFDANSLALQFMQGLVGRGRIIVCAAGNDANALRHVGKPADEANDVGTAFCFNGSLQAEFAMSVRSRRRNDMLLSVYANRSAALPDTTIALPAAMLSAESPAWERQIVLRGGADTILVADTAFVSPYAAADTIDYIEMICPPPSHYGGIGNLPVYALRTAQPTACRVDIFQHNFPTYASLLRQAGLPAQYADSRYTMSGLAASDSFISVGGAASRLSYTSASGSTYSFAPDASYPAHAAFSSLGPTLDERTKPDVVAPAIYTTSASSNALCNAPGVSHPSARDIVDSTLVGRDVHYWIQMSGTSMAAPVVTGTIALWLQADPTLTPARVREIIRNTSRHIDPALAAADYPNNVYGYGEIDAYRGLLYILGLSTSIPGLSQSQPASVAMRLEGKRLLLDFGGKVPAKATVRVYSTDGTLRLSQRLLAGTLDLSALPRGIYAVQLDVSGDSRATGSTLIRL